MAKLAKSVALLELQARESKGPSSSSSSSTSSSSSLSSVPSSLPPRGPVARGGALDRSAFAGSNSGILHMTQLDQQSVKQLHNDKVVSSLSVIDPLTELLARERSLVLPPSQHPALQLPARLTPALPGADVPLTSSQLLIDFLNERQKVAVTPKSFKDFAEWLAEIAKASRAYTTAGHANAADRCLLLIETMDTIRNQRGWAAADAYWWASMAQMQKGHFDLWHGPPLCLQALVSILERFPQLTTGRLPTRAVSSSSASSSSTSSSSSSTSSASSTGRGKARSYGTPNKHCDHHGTTFHSSAECRHLHPELPRTKASGSPAPANP